MSRSAHVIARTEVGTWLADSAVRTVTFHGTTTEAAHGILAHGPRVELGDPEATWGQGFYSSTLPDLHYGDTIVRVAVRITRPWVMRDTLQAVEELESLMEDMRTSARRDALIAAGYDGVIVQYGPGDAWVVALHNDQIKVVWRA